MRSAASVNSNILGAVQKGSTVTIVGETTVSGTVWYKIVFGNGTGWVSGAYITNITTSPVSSISFPKSYYIVNVGSTVTAKIEQTGLSVNYSTSNSANAPINSNGVITGKVKGLYKITAKVGNSTATADVVVLGTPYTLTDAEKNLQISDDAIKFIADYEGGGVDGGDELGLIFPPYKDPSGFWTIGYGHARTSTASKSWSKERIITEFKSDIDDLLGADVVKLDAEKPYLTQDEAFALLKAEFVNSTYSSSVRNWAVRNGVRLTQNQFDALVSFAYNLGAAYWTDDSYYFYLKCAIISHRSGSEADQAQVTDGFSRYYRSGSNYYRGLFYRRMDEAEMFKSGDYKRDGEKFKNQLPSGVDWT